MCVHVHVRICFLTQLSWKSCLHLGDGWKRCWAKTVTKNSCQLLYDGIILEESEKTGRRSVISHISAQPDYMKREMDGHAESLRLMLLPWLSVRCWTSGAGRRWPAPRSSPPLWWWWTLWGATGWHRPSTAAGHNAEIPATRAASRVHLGQGKKMLFSFQSKFNLESKKILLLTSDRYP